MRAGDRDAFLKAKAEADAALKTTGNRGQVPASSPRLISEFAGEALLIVKLDHADLFKLG